MKKLPQRKTIRLQNYDYSQPGYYFMTICTYNMKNLLGTFAQDSTTDTPHIQLTTIGKQVQENLSKLPEIYPGITTEPYVIMPNHIHFIIRLTDKNNNPTLPQLIGRFKSYTTKLYGTNLWQRSYYDRVIRSKTEYLAIYEYIQTNPLRWELDKYHQD